MRPRPSWRFWALSLLAGVLGAGVVAAGVLTGAFWVGPAFLLVGVLSTVGLSRERSLRAMSEQRRRGWALSGALLAFLVAGALLIVGFLVAWSIACEGGC